MKAVKIKITTIKNLIVLLFLVIISFAVGLLGKLITNKPLTSIAQAQSCWTPPESAGSAESNASAGSAEGSEGCASESSGCF